MITILIWLIAAIVIAAIVFWFLQQVNLRPPWNFVVHGLMAILAIIMVLWILSTTVGRPPGF